MKFSFFVFVFSFQLAQAGIDPLVLIRGTATGNFSDKEIQVKDTYNQIYYLPREVFPKGFTPDKGKTFSVEVHEKLLKNLKVEKPQKK